MPLFNWALLVTGVLMSAAGGLFLKLGALKIEYDLGIASIIYKLAFNWEILLGVLMYFIPVLIWIFLLKKIELSYLQPLFSMVYVVTPVLAIYVLHEHVPAARWIGIGFILIGVVIVARN